MKVVPPEPWPLACEPAEYELVDVTSIQALASGQADAQQQMRALKWIIEKAADVYGLGWHPGGPHDAAFVAGRRNAGLQVVKIIHLNVSVLRKKENV